MNDLGVIDHFLDVFSLYIDSGFGLLGREVSFLTATLVVIDITLAGLFWAMGGTDDVIARLIKKTLYIGTFAFIITDFSSLAGILFRSFAGLGLLASGNHISPSQFLRPGWLAGTGVDAARPLLQQIGELTGFPTVFLNLDTIAVLFLAWLVVIVSFFVLAIQLFVTLIEFKLTTLAGFVLVPFALWNRTAFLAERVLGNVVSAGVKVLVLAVVVGIGSTIFTEFHSAIGSEPSLDQALAIMLASLTLFGLGIFGPGIATGLVAGAPQLGAGAAAGTAIGTAGLAVGAGAAIAGGARLAKGVASASTSLVGSARAGYAEGKAGSAATASAAGGNGSRASSPPGRGSQLHDGRATEVATASSSESDAPAWAQRMRRGQQLAHGASTAAHALRASDHGGSGPSPRLDQPEER